ncbi:MAG: hypothetical protein S4CHLAM123_03260 [Chlamydiales bacterium]|nr:hypothetical protein [Chlamydiales bacterium]
MSKPIPVNLPSIQQRAAKQDAKELNAKQEASKARFMENVERGFNRASLEKDTERDKFRTLENRKKHPESVEQRITEVESKSEEDLAQNYNRRNPELPSDKLRSLKESIHKEQSPEEILEQVDKAFEDATLADEALEYLEKSTEGPLQDKVKAAKTLLNELRGREVIAGRNVDAAAKSFHKQGVGQNPTELRNLYRDITGNPRDHNTLFTELSEKYPFDDLKLLTKFLLKGLAYDLKSKGPSIQAAELMRLMTEARNLQSILWVYLFFKSRQKMMRMLYKQYGLKDKKTKPAFEKLAKEFIKLAEERYPSVMKLLKQGDQLDLDDLEKIIVFMQYRDAIRGLSPRIYKTNRHKQDLLLVILETLDELEERQDMEDEEA